MLLRSKHAPMHITACLCTRRTQLSEAPPLLLPPALPLLARLRAVSPSCYFKDEVQRQALEKLNQKRKWYQQQLEAERMMARSMAKSRQAAAAARGNKPNGRPGAPA